MVSQFREKLSTGKRIWFHKSLALRFNFNFQGFSTECLCPWSDYSMASLISQIN